MKKMLFLVLALFTIAGTVSAQKFTKGTKIATANVGIGGSYGIPISVQYEQGIYDINSDMSIGVGGYLGFATDGEQGGRASTFIGAARGYFHYTRFDRFDLYGVLGLGFWNQSWSYSDWPESDYSHTGLDLNVSVGARYYLNDKFAVHSEVGYGISFLSLGVTYKF
jgi:opacity protein-like surface antigen